MYTISDIARSKQSVALIESYFDFSLLKESEPEIRKNEIKSTSMIGSVVEQFILTYQYKHNKKSSLRFYISHYKEKIQEWKKMYIELEDDLKVDYFNIKSGRLYSTTMRGEGDIIIYNDYEKMKLTDPYSIVESISSNSIKESTPYNFIDNLVKFSFIRTGQVFYLEYHKIMEIISTIFNLLIKNVYSKRIVKDIDVIKLLYFQNILINWPYYLTGGSPKTDAHNLYKLFRNYDEEIHYLANSLDKCKDLIAKLGNLISYQERIEYKNIGGRVDFISTDSLIEIKTGDKRMKKDLVQIFLYMLISKANKSDIKYFKLVFPFKNLIYEYDIDLVLSRLNVTPEFLLNEVVQLHEKTVNEKKEKFIFELRRKSEKEEELKRKKEHKKEEKRQEKIKEKAKLKQQIIKDKEKKELQLSRKRKS
ncbi:MAG: hypothetical protein WCI53_09980 [Bacteroidota bacterium]|jgi:hypothetical protein